MANPQSVSDMSQYNGWLKIRYAKNPSFAVPDKAIDAILKLFLFAGMETLAKTYNIPVVLNLGGGDTFAAPNSGAFNYNEPVSGRSEEASVNSFDIISRSKVPYTDLQRAAGGGEKSFGNFMDLQYRIMETRLKKKQLIEALYGQEGLGVVSSVATNAITITALSWAPLIWTVSRGETLEIRDTTGATLRGYCTLNPATGTLPVITSTKVINVDSCPAGVVATDVIWYKGQFGNTCLGVSQRVQKTTGTMDGITVTDNEMWQATTFSAGSAALSFTKFQGIVAAMTDKGAYGECTSFLNTHAFSDIISAELVSTTNRAQRNYDASYSKEMTTQGTMKVRFVEQNGEIELVPSAFIKNGIAPVLRMQDWIRVGVTDMTRTFPGTDGDFIQPIPGAHGAEIRAWANTVPFCKLPAMSGCITAIVNTL
jgi:hypothetical protein